MPTNTNPNTLTRRQIANRENAKKSTGPRTEEGKRRVSQNALKHGLTAATHMNTVFDQTEDFAQFQQGLLEEFNPQTRLQAALVDRIITLMWRLRRIPLIEAAIMEHKLARRDTNPKSMAYLRDGGAVEFLHLSRYEANLDRCLHRALKDLENARASGQSAICNPQSEIGTSQSSTVNPSAGRQSPTANSHPNRQSPAPSSDSSAPKEQHGDDPKTIPLWPAKKRRGDIHTSR